MKTITLTDEEVEILLSILDNDNWDDDGYGSDEDQKLITSIYAKLT